MKGMGIKVTQSDIIKAFDLSSVVQANPALAKKVRETMLGCVVLLNAIYVVTGYAWCITLGVLPLLTYIALKKLNTPYQRKEWLLKHN